MNPVSSPSKPRSLVAHLLAGVLGGLVVLVAGAVLISTDVIDTGDTERVVTQAPIARPAADADGGGEGRTVQDIYREEGRGVVFVEARGAGGGGDLFDEPGPGVATGSGFVVDDDGTIVTNAHVVEGASDVSVRFGENGDSVEAEVRGRDADSDLAVLKIDPGDVDDLTVLPLGDSSQVEVGDPVVAIGNPFGLERTVTTGIVSAVQRQIEAPTGFSIPNVIQTDASINPGNSGGPLLDAEGRVIGINSQIATGGGGGSVGIGFAVPVDKAKQLLPRLRRGGEIEHAYLGLTLADVSEQVADDLNLPAEQGALVQTVEDGGPADEAGLRGGRTETADGLVVGGDLIVSVDGEEVNSPSDVIAAIDDNDPGDTVEIRYYRDEDERTVDVRLGERPEQAGSAELRERFREREPDLPEGDGGGLFPPIP